MYYIMRKSYYVMHKLLRYAKNVLRYAVIITLCGNYYVMWRHTRHLCSILIILWGVTKTNIIRTENVRGSVKVEPVTQNGRFTSIRKEKQMKTENHVESLMCKRDMESVGLKEEDVLDRTQ